MPGVTIVTFFVFDKVILLVMMMGKLGFCIKEGLILATLARPGRWRTLGLDMVVFIRECCGSVKLGNSVPGLILSVRTENIRNMERGEISISWLKRACWSNMM